MIRELICRHSIRTRVGSGWPQRTQQDMKRHKAAGERRSDSGLLHFLSIGSSTAEGAVLQGGLKKYK